MNNYNKIDKIDMKELRRYLTTKNNKISVKGDYAFNLLFELLIGNKVYLHEITKVGRYSKQGPMLLVSEFESILYYLDLKVTYQNDRPRGGALGNHYLIKTKNTKEEANHTIIKLMGELTKK